ncbi:MAG: glucans biosynthesis glucosyltransferase MdoH [Alphaproteobacteria bacterium]
MTSAETAAAHGLPRNVTPPAEHRRPVVGDATHDVVVRPLFFALVATTVLGGGLILFDILRANGLSLTEALILPLFVITFGWIALSFWTAVAGFVLRLVRLDPLTLRRYPPALAEPAAAAAAATLRTAIVMPIRNEDPAAALGCLETTCRSLQATGQFAHFHVFVLSDSDDAALFNGEAEGTRALARRLGAAERFHYRRRTSNEGRKAGNIAAFCHAHGADYDAMLVLDADSVMTGETILALITDMSRRADAGIIQTVPLPVGQSLIFGRAIQFAARLSSPMLATGHALWQRGESNYWGHNALVRLAPFHRHAMLTPLPGPPPMGGDIMSHDFVEAALLRRAGHRTYVRADLGGSYEGLPGDLFDYLARERRWAQGNLQHLRLLALPGLHVMSRLNLLLGALAFLASPIWLGLLALTTVSAMSWSLGTHDYFTAGRQLFPDWLVGKPDEIRALFIATAAMLFLPKVLALILALTSQTARAGFGGGLTLTASTLAESLFAVLMAPVIMLYHSRFVAGILAGRAVGWRSPRRGEGAADRTLALRAGRLPGLVGLVWGGVTLAAAPLFFWWLAPVLLGLVAAAPMIMLSGDKAWGRRVMRAGVFRTPEEMVARPDTRPVHGRPDDRGLLSAAG